MPFFVGERAAMSGGQLNDLSNKEDDMVRIFLYRLVKDLCLSPLKSFCSLFFVVSLYG